MKTRRRFDPGEVMDIITVETEAVRTKFTRARKLSWRSVNGIFPNPTVATPETMDFLDTNTSYGIQTVTFWVHYVGDNTLFVPKSRHRFRLTHDGTFNTFYVAQHLDDFVRRIAVFPKEGNLMVCLIKDDMASLLNGMLSILNSSGRLSGRAAVSGIHGHPCFSHKIFAGFLAVHPVRRKLSRRLSPRRHRKNR